MNLYGHSSDLPRKGELDTPARGSAGQADSHPMKVSIVIAVYNEAATVATLLERVWAQPLPEAAKEIIIIESNSTDGSRQIVAEFLARHAAESSQRIQVIHQPRPRGKG